MAQDKKTDGEGRQENDKPQEHYYREPQKKENLK